MNAASIVIAGVGGQGTLLASRIIGGAAIKSGCDVKVSEVHGMSQRGGSVITFVRYGDGKVSSPVIDSGQADAVLAFELLEAYRCVPYVKKAGGRIIANLQKSDPMPVITGAMDFPENIPEKIRGLGIPLDLLDATALAVKSGNSRAVNVVLIGRLAAALSFPKEIWLAVLRETVKPAFLETNVSAFDEGYYYKGK
ncbi:MAG: indolepyruvate oxidoreductase subunit beta [Clostridiales bacterium]|jgi:indolepyruvate ferredoxin oxidoreductase beta subunit|nr:indolepyruvate oxidoreductase subunit beta [Clostridiales bacterium]